MTHFIISEYVHLDPWAVSTWCSSRVRVNAPGSGESGPLQEGLGFSILKREKSGERIYREDFESVKRDYYRERMWKRNEAP